MKWLWLLPLALSGCLYAVPATLFRTYEESSAFDRAVQAVDSHCYGAKDVNREGQTVMSRWQPWHTSSGVILSRCMVTLVGTQEEEGLDVRVSFMARECPLVDIADPEAIADDCRAAEAIPSVVADQLSTAIKAIEADVRR
jgi:hypothetical protein